MWKYLIPVWVVIVLLFGVTIYSIVEEISKPSWTTYKNYTVELHYLNGEVETQTYTLPDNIHLQVNCHSRKNNFQGCDLEYVDTDLIMGGHWKKVVSGVNHFKLIQ